MSHAHRSRLATGPFTPGARDVAARLRVGSGAARGCMRDRMALPCQRIRLGPCASVASMSAPSGRHRPGAPRARWSRPFRRVDPGSVVADRRERAVDPGSSRAAAAMAMTDGSAPAGRREPDPHSAAWVAALTGPEGQRDAALGRLHRVLLRAALFEIDRRGDETGCGRGDDLDDLALQAAEDALKAIISRLHTYRGDSRFTTWACKFALFEVGVKLRRREWHDREIPREPVVRAELTARRASPDADAHTAELIAAVTDAIADALTDHERAVLIALTFHEVPIDVLAERLGTTRGAVYQTLHDARRKLNARLRAQGLASSAAGTTAWGRP